MSVKKYLAGVGDLSMWGYPLHLIWQERRMRRRHFIKLISIFTVIFPFLKSRNKLAEYDRELKKVAILDNPFENCGLKLHEGNPYKLYESHLSLLRKYEREVLIPKWRKMKREALIENYPTGLVNNA